MTAYIIRRLLLGIPTLIGIMTVNFVIIQIAPGGPVEQMIAKLQGEAVSATERLSGGGEDVKGQKKQFQKKLQNIEVHKVWLRNWLKKSNKCTGLTNLFMFGFLI